MNESTSRIENEFHPVRKVSYPNEKGYFKVVKRVILNSCFPKQYWDTTLKSAPSPQKCLVLPKP